MKVPVFKGYTWVWGAQPLSLVYTEEPPEGYTCRVGPLDELAFSSPTGDLTEP